jgi:hypothetical protein
MFVHTSVNEMALHTYIMSSLYLIMAKAIYMPRSTKFMGFMLVFVVFRAIVDGELIWKFMSQKYDLRAFSNQQYLRNATRTIGSNTSIITESMQLQQQENRTVTQIVSKTNRSPPIEAATSHSLSIVVNMQDKDLGEDLSHLALAVMARTRAWRKYNITTHLVRTESTNSVDDKAAGATLSSPLSCFPNITSLPSITAAELEARRIQQKEWLRKEAQEKAILLDLSMELLDDSLAFLQEQLSTKAPTSTIDGSNSVSIPFLYIDSNVLIHQLDTDSVAVMVAEFLSSFDRDKCCEAELPKADESVLVSRQSSPGWYK